jgi:hypothetical protein
LKLADQLDILDDVAAGRAGARCIAAATHRLHAMTAHALAATEWLLSPIPSRSYTGSARHKMTRLRCR